MHLPNNTVHTHLFPLGVEFGVEGKIGFPREGSMISHQFSLDIKSQTEVELNST